MGVKVTFLNTSPHVKVKNDHRSKFSNQATGKKKPEKIRASTGFEAVTSANKATH